jgi:type VI secretion system protein ImpJ
MTWTNRILWHEGIFLRAQHFQQQDRWLEATLRARVAALRPYPWGITSLAIDRSLLATGRFAVLSVSGIFEDGTTFEIPRDADHPTVLEVPSNTKNELVFLAVPIGQAGALEVASGDAGGARWGVHGFEAFDTHSASPHPAEIQVGRLRLRYMLESETRNGYFCIGLARISEVKAGQVVLDDAGWMPPTMLVAAVPALAGLVTFLAGILNQRGNALDLRLAQPGQRGLDEITDFQLLQVINRFEGLLLHWSQAGQLHPHDLYEALLQLEAELATFKEAGKRRPTEYRPYRHDDLQRSFAPVVADIRRWLADKIDDRTVSIKLEVKPFGYRLAILPDPNIVRSARIILVVQAQVPLETLRVRFPGQLKIGSQDEIKSFVTSAVPGGITVKPIPTIPKQLPPYENAVYFELDPHTDYWRKIQSAGNLVLHVAGDVPGLWMELWALRSV